MPLYTFFQVAVIYFRCGYSPDQYFGETEWNSRLMMERSLAIKSPSIHYHLAGTKKVQQKLAVNGVLEKYFDDKNQIEKIRGIFTGLYSLDATVNNDRNIKIYKNIINGKSFK
jgi:glutathione synthase